MKIKSLATTLLLPAACCCIALTGCTTMSETYAGHDSTQVWAAMVAAANSPEYYPEWTLEENNIWADDANWRVEVDRHLRRDLIVPMGNPQRQEREMQFSIYLTEEEEGPTIEFVSKQLDVPAKAREEASMYFNEVWAVLGGRPMNESDMADDLPNTTGNSSTDVYDN